MPEDLAVLFGPEIFWRDHQEWLKDCGYMLRPRYRPDWEPSWLERNVDPLECEDAVPLSLLSINDATRISDGKHVVLKIVNTKRNPHEIDIGTFFSSEALAADSNNHCVPVYQVLKIPDVKDSAIIVMPLLRRWNSPSFETIGEAVDFFEQLFQGLQFMHKHHVAHRDISVLNVMMDGSLFPEGWHFSQTEQDPHNPKKAAKHYNRIECPPRYYIIDFGLSRQYDPKNGPPLERPIKGGDRTVPEFQKSIVPCNPFPADIYCAGNFIRENIIRESKGGFGFMRSLISDMVQDDPGKRPKIDEVVTRFATIRQELGNLKLRARVSDREETFGPVHDIAHLFKSVTRTVQGVPAAPSRPAP